MYLELILSIVIFAVVPVIIKLTTANPFTIGFFRLLITVILLAILWNKKIHWTSFQEKSFWKIIVAGVCFFCHWITYTFAVKIGGPSVGVLGMATYGIQLLFYGSFFLGYHVFLKHIICLILILIGVIFIIPDWNFHNATTLGLFLALISASFYAVIPIMLQKSQEFNQETRIFFQFIIALSGYVILFPQTNWEDLRGPDWYSLSFLAVLGTFVAHTLWSRCTARLPTTTTAIVYYLITPLAMGLSVFFLKEILSFEKILGGSIILVAALINAIKIGPSFSKKKQN